MDYVARLEKNKKSSMVLNNHEMRADKNLEQQSISPVVVLPVVDKKVERSHELTTTFLAIVLDLHRRLIEEVKLTVPSLQNDNPESEEYKKVRAHVEKELLVLIERHYPNAARKEKADLVNGVVYEVLGLGPLEYLVHDPSINEIMVNGPSKIFIERNGVIQRSSVIFYDNDHVKHTIQRIVAKVGRRIDEAMPMVDARLKDGSRVNAIIPPLALSGPTITIRKFRDKGFTSKDLVRFGSLSNNMDEFLRLAVKARLNILVSGGTGSGKTTLLNILSSFIPEDERIVTIEDSAELRLRQDHVITLETRPANIEGSGEVRIRDLVRNALRMRPDRLIVGEVRGGEALDMLQAMNTGHDGSMTTAHANNPQDSILRLETMVLMSGVDLPIRAIRQQISSAFDLIVQIARMQDGSRKVTGIVELNGMEGETLLFKEIFGFQQEGYDEAQRKVVGSFYATGLMPTAAKKIRERGLSIPETLFR